MAKMLYSVTMSLDGFIAGPGGDMSWLTAHLGPNPTVERAHRPRSARCSSATARSAATTRTGATRTGRASRSAAAGTARSSCSPTTPRPSRCRASPSSDDLGSGVAAAKAAAGDKYVNILGADVARQCLEAGVLDEILVFIAPVLLGDGVRLFDHPGGTNVKLERISLT